MALKFLNKKGWHTGSLRNIENVWKAEQKHDAEQKKLEELRKQIQEEKERHEFRLLQEQAGLVPKQERLEFLYDSGLAVGKSSGSDGFKALEAAPKPTTNDTPSSSASVATQPSVPGALFEDKPHSANDAWRKLHSDPLLMIRQREQEALVRVKNNPIQMAMIRKSVETKKQKEKSHDRKEHRKKRRHSSSNREKHSSSERKSDSREYTGEKVKSKARHQKSSKYDEDSYSEDGSGKNKIRNEKNFDKSLKYKEKRASRQSHHETTKSDALDAAKRNHDRSEREKDYAEGQKIIDASRKERESRSLSEIRSYKSSVSTLTRESNYMRRNVAPKLSEEERAARLREMQMNAEVHDEQRWKRLKKAEEDDAREATQSGRPGDRNFLDAAQKSVYGAEKEGSSTIEESVRRRAYYSQGRSEASEHNAFRR